MMELMTMAFSTPRLTRKKMPHRIAEPKAMAVQLVPVSPSDGKNVPRAIIIMVAKAMLPIQPETQ